MEHKEQGRDQQADSCITDQVGNIKKNLTGGNHCKSDSLKEEKWNEQILLISSIGFMLQPFAIWNPVRSETPLCVSRKKEEIMRHANEYG